MKFAVIETGGKQYIASAGKKIKIEKIEAEAGSNYTFDKILLVGDSETGKAEIGAPAVEGAKVEAKIIKQARDDKKIVFKYHSKTGYRKKKGHRQYYTEVEIVKV